MSVNSSYQILPKQYTPAELRTSKLAPHNLRSVVRQSVSLVSFPLHFHLTLSISPEFTPNTSTFLSATACVIHIYIYIHSLVSYSQFYIMATNHSADFQRIQVAYRQLLLLVETTHTDRHSSTLHRHTTQHVPQTYYYHSPGEYFLHVLGMLVK